LVIQQKKTHKRIIKTIKIRNEKERNDNEDIDCMNIIINKSILFQNFLEEENKHEKYLNVTCSLPLQEKINYYNCQPNIDYTHLYSHAPIISPLNAYGFYPQSNCNYFNIDLMTYNPHLINFINQQQIQNKEINLQNKILINANNSNESEKKKQRRIQTQKNKTKISLTWI